MDWGALLGDPKHPAYETIVKIVGDLRRDYLLWFEKVGEFELASVHSTAGEPTEEVERLQREVQALAVDIESYVAELNYLGVEFDVKQLFSKMR